MSFFTLHWRHLGVARAAPRRAPWERLGCSPWPWPGRCLALAWAVAWPWPGPGLGLALACPLPGLGLSFGLWRPVAVLLWLGLWLPRRWGVWLGWLLCLWAGYRGCSLWRLWLAVKLWFHCANTLQTQQHTGPRIRQHTHAHAVRSVCVS